MAHLVLLIVFSGDVTNRHGTSRCILLQVYSIYTYTITQWNSTNYVIRKLQETYELRYIKKRRDYKTELKQIRIIR